MEYEIRKVKNGWIFTYKDPENEEIIVGTETEDEVDCFMDFLRTIDEHFGPSSSKYSDKRIRIIAIPGNSYEGKLDKEYKKKLSDLYEELKVFVKTKH